MVNASLSDCAGGRECGAGFGMISCPVPPFDGTLGTPAEASFDGRDVTVEITLNGQVSTAVILIHISSVSLTSPAQHLATHACCVGVDLAAQSP